MRLISSALGLALAAGGVLVAAPPAAAGTTGLPHAVGGFPTPTTRVAVSPLVRAMDVLPDRATLVSNLPPVGDQGQIGSCVAWTIAHSIMGFYAKRDGGSGAPYAPLYLYMRVVAKGGAPNAGLNPEQALTEAAANGVDSQDDYVQGTLDYQSPPTATEIANAANYKVAGWNTLWVGDHQGDKAKTAIETAIAGGSPVAIGIPVFRDFMYLTGSSLYRTTIGSSLGGHMITAYAYDAEGIWIRNQWGTGWGASGDAHLSWAFVNTDVMAAYTVAGVTTPAVPAAPKPTVSALSVVRGPAIGGTEVRIAGGNLATATGVKFGDTGAAFKKSEVNGVTTLVATTPAHPRGTVDVTVVNPGGASAPSSQARFTYVPPAPAVTKLSVSSTSVLGGATVTVTGTDLTDATAVKIGTAPAVAGSVKVASPTSLAFTVPATLTAGVYDVTVSTPYGTSAAVAAGKLSLLNPPAPTVTALSAGSGPTYASTPVTVTGSNFSGVRSVTAGGVALTYQRLSDTQLKVVMPIHAAGPVTLRITTIGGAFEATSLPFVYVAPAAPSVSALSPSGGAARTWTAVELAGTNLGTASRVTVDGVAVSFVKLSDGRLRLSMPPHAAGAAVVLVTTAGGTSAPAAGAVFTYRI